MPTTKRRFAPGLLAFSLLACSWTCAFAQFPESQNDEPTSSARASMFTPPKEKLRVAVSILPEAYFVERIGGDRVEIQVLVAPGQSPHTFDPTPREIADLSRADVYFRIGMPFEETLLKKVRAAKKDLNVVDLTNGISLLDMTAGDEGEERDHGKEEAGHVHRKGEPDPHFWLDPARAEMMTHTMYEAMWRLQPGNRAFFLVNTTVFIRELGKTDEEVAKMLAPFKGKSFFVFHPAFGYFASAYGLNQVAVETGGKEPGARHTADLIERAKADGVKTIFVQPQFSTKTASAMAEAIGGRVAPIDDLSKDYLANLVKMAEAIRDGFASGAPPNAK